MKAWIAGVVLLALVPADAVAQPTDVRPSFHFSPQRNWMNDPNGLVYFDGEYHLFFQYNPYGDRWGHMSWGHAVSTDLMNWQELPVAIPERDVMAYSGSAVVDWDNSSGFGDGKRPPLVAIYTGHNVRNGNQSQFVAYSNDRGRTWAQYGQVLDIGSKDFRDPKVFWDAKRRHWTMVVAKAAENKISIYRSSDLKTWHHKSDFGPVGARAGSWECPDLFELPVVNDSAGGSRWVLLVSVSDKGPGGGSGMQYFVGDFDGEKFVADPLPDNQPLWVDRGADFYAGVTWNDLPKADKRRIMIAWASDWRYASAVPTYPARGLMSLPRALSLRKLGTSYRLAQAPVGELDQLQALRKQRSDIILDQGKTKLPISGGRVDLRVTVDRGTADQVVFSLTDDQGYETLFGITAATNEVFIDRTRSNPHFDDRFADRHVATIAEGKQLITLRVVVDESIIELFADDGTVSITDRFFPRKGGLHWSASAQGGTARLQSLDVRMIGASVRGR